MDVIPGLLGEKECSFFNPTDFDALRGVLNDALAKDIKEYLSNPMANPAVVNNLNLYLGETLESLTFHFVLQEMGIADLLQTVMPQHLATSGVDLDEVLEKLTFLEQNESKLLTTIPARTKVDWDRFLAAMTNVQFRMSQAGEKTTYPNWVQVLKANSFAFYVPREKPVETGNKVFATRKRQWITTLRGAQYIKRCEQENIPYHARRRF